MKDQMKVDKTSEMLLRHAHNHEADYFAQLEGSGMPKKHVRTAKVLFTQAQVRAMNKSHSEIGIRAHEELNRINDLVYNYYNQERWFNNEMVSTAAVLDMLLDIQCSIIKGE